MIGGGCHCGGIRLSFHTQAPLTPRACQCGFCRKHGARTVSDPAGAAILSFGHETIRYRFGTGTTEFLVCGRCGVYVAALADIEGAVLATLNLNAFDDPRLELRAEPFSYDGEDAAARAARRRLRWTPARLAAD